MTREEILQAAYARGFDKAAAYRRGFEKAAQLTDNPWYGKGNLPGADRVEINQPLRHRVVNFFRPNTYVPRPEDITIHMSPRFGNPYRSEDVNRVLDEGYHVKSTPAAAIASQYPDDATFRQEVADANAYRATRPDLFGPDRHLPGQLTDKRLSAVTMVTDKPGRLPTHAARRHAANHSGVGFYSNTGRAVFMHPNNAYAGTFLHEMRHGLHNAQPHNRMYDSDPRWGDKPKEMEAEGGSYMATARGMGFPRSVDTGKAIVGSRDGLVPLEQQQAYSRAMEDYNTANAARTARRDAFWEQSKEYDKLPFFQKLRTPQPEFPHEPFPEMPSRPKPIPYPEGLGKHLDLTPGNKPREQWEREFADRLPGFVQNQTRNDQLEAAYARGFEKAGQAYDAVTRAAPKVPQPARAALAASSAAKPYWERIDPWSPRYFASDADRAPGTVGSRGTFNHTRFLEDIYGGENNLRKEVGAAGEYAKSHEIPVDYSRMLSGYTQPMAMEHGAGGSYDPANNTIAIPGTGHTPSPAEFSMRPRDGIAEEGHNSERSQQQTAGHELAHAMYDPIKSPRLYYRPRGGLARWVSDQYSDVLSTNPEAYARLSELYDQYKGHPQVAMPERIPAHAAKNRSAGDQEELHAKEFGRLQELNAYITPGSSPSHQLGGSTYPEKEPAEFTPAASALQHYAYNITGQRITSPEQYAEFIAGLESPERFKQLPSEVQRLVTYRNVMRDQDPSGKRLAMFDSVLGRMMGAIVTNDSVGRNDQLKAAQSSLKPEVDPVATASGALMVNELMSKPRYTKASAKTPWAARHMAKYQPITSGALRSRVLPFVGRAAGTASLLAEPVASYAGAIAGGGNMADASDAFLGGVDNGGPEEVAGMYELEKAYRRGFEKGASSATDALQAGREVYPNVVRGVTAGGLMDTAKGVLRPFNYRGGSPLSPLWKRHELAHWSKGTGLVPSLSEEMRAGFASGSKYNLAGSVSRSPIRGVTESLYQAARHPHYLGNTASGRALASKPVQALASGVRGAGNALGNIHAGLRMYAGQAKNIAKQVVPYAAAGAAKTYGTAALTAAKPVAAAAGKFVALPAAAAATGAGIGYGARRLSNHLSGGLYDKGMNAAGGWLADQRNDLEAPALLNAPAIGTALDAVRAEGQARLVRMSGSGATVFGLYEDAAAAARAAEALAGANPHWWVRQAHLG